MHQKMTFKIKNWKLALLALIFICFFIALGCWQVSRANQKKALLQAYAERAQHSPLTAHDLNQPGDWRFYRATLSGTYDNEHSLLLDNTIYKGQVGYEVYTPFRANGLATPILIDRGFVPIGRSRQELPSIYAITGNVQILALINQPLKYVAYGQINDSSQIRWPLRIEYVKTSELTKLLGYAIAPYVLNLSPDDPAAYTVEWKVVTMGPERHMGYAVQWFAFALTLLILFVALNRNKE
jgi:surfeit locus 1 family protein